MAGERPVPELHVVHEGAGHEMRMGTREPVGVRERGLLLGEDRGLEGRTDEGGGYRLDLDGIQRPSVLLRWIGPDTATRQDQDPQKRRGGRTASRP